MTLRKSKSFANYRVKAVVLAKEYEAKEKQVVTEDDIKQLLTSKVDSGGITEQAIMESPEKCLVYLQTLNKLNEKIAECKESFLVEDDFKNARLLCEIWYEDFDFDKFLNETEKYDELLAFLFETLTAFFLSRRSLTNSAVYGKQNSTTETKVSQT